VSVVCCQAEVSATSWSLAQRKVCCVWVWSGILDKDEALAHWGLLRHGKKVYFYGYWKYRMFRISVPNLGFYFMSNFTWKVLNEHRVSTIITLLSNTCVLVVCLLSGRGLCDELIIRPEESYRLWWVVVCDLETSRTLGRSATEKKSDHLVRIKVKSWRQIPSKVQVLYNMCDGTGIAQSVQRLARSWTVRESNPVGGGDFSHPSRPALGSTQPPIQSVPGLSRG